MDEARMSGAVRNGVRSDDVDLWLMDDTVSCSPAEFESLALSAELEEMMAAIADEVFGEKDEVRAAA